MVERLTEDNVIDNREIKLKDALNDILPQIKTVDIAVGYFYFSGLSQVIDTLEKTDKIRLLLSPTLDNHTVESLFDVYQDTEKAKEKFRDIIDSKPKKERETEVIEDAEKKARRQLEISKQTQADEKIINRMKKLIQSGVLGKIYHCRMFYGNGTARLVKNSEWRDKKQGVLTDLGSHLLDTIKFWWHDVSAKFEIHSSNCFENRSPDHVIIG